MARELKSAAGSADDQKTPVLLITGPTASGKTAVAMELCRRLNGEIIGADSMQVYQGMDIGTAKASREELALVRHHLVDICHPGDEFSVAAYIRLAEAAIRDVQNRGRLAVVCGGTGQYIQALLEGLRFTETPVDPDLRRKLNQRAEAEGLERLWQELEQVDPQSAAAIARSDQKRIVRGLELYLQTGLTKSEHNRRSRQAGPQFLFRAFCLSHQRPLLYERINRRVDEMIAQGLEVEVRRLLAAGVAPGSPCMQAIGYKEMIVCLKGEQSLAAAADQIRQASRRYAKRQLTWFRRLHQLEWLENYSTEDAVDYIMAKVNG